MAIDDRAAKRAAEIARKAAILESAKINRGLEEILASPNGRAFLWWQLGEFGFGGQPYTNNAVNTGFNCGLLQAALLTLARVEQVDPAGFVRMQAERLNNGTSGNADLDTASAGTIARDDGTGSAEPDQWERDD